jgi:hypothetical protein
VSPRPLSGCLPGRSVPREGRIVRRGPAVLALLVAGACSTAGPEPSPYVGISEPPLPPGVELLAGALVDFDPASTFAVSWLRDAGGDMLWLERLVSRDAAGVPLWTVVAVERLPPMGADETVVLGGCGEGELAGGGEGDVHAVVRREDREILERVSLAWRVDTGAERFVALRTEGLRCVNEGYGE